ncbi:alpha-galactosidase [Saccharothrix luteola]|uniref:alpha-galactosidase n=1 Tax=Saccharothrix luteola TaxID=2893018 RepID=UPI001E2AC40E|nr:alpha-galactosidase [Saccharothrix luteola]MCC8243149.1 alpha-galactosidase [Saccharothrix luteola]
MSTAPPVTAPAVDGVGRIVHLRADGVSLVLRCKDSGLPHVLHWGADLGPDAGLDAVAATSVPAVVPNATDTPGAVAVLPEHATAWPGLPGLRGHREGRDWSPLLTVERVVENGDSCRVHAVDAEAGLALDLEVGLTPSGLARLRATVRNTGDTAYTLDGVVLALPVPPRATELLDLTGRWGRERTPQRRPFGVEAHVRDSRRGRTGSDATLVLVAGESGFGFRRGRVWGVHVAWSGNHRTYAERVPTGEAVLGGGELLLEGEVRLEPGEAYSTPEVFGSCGDGLDELSARFHRHLRSRPHHPKGPRRVVLNTWEAVYFDHDLERLRALADRGAEVGAELFVLDDGWFRNRRDDTAGLGDWHVDERVWPDGLHPLVDHVRAQGMEFGLWVEPEMVSADSDLLRNHPDWVLSTGGRRPPLVRGQHVLDLTRPEVRAHLLERLDALVTEYRIAYLKWDHNRDLVDAGDSRTGRAAVHAQTLAVYGLLDELRRRHPGLEVESCSSGGSRVDLGILERADRVWASDCIDALDRQGIQRWTGLLLPPELIGAHIGAARSHTTGRVHDLDFRAATALFGHLGIEWDLAAADPAELAGLARWVGFYRRVRGWLHRGRVVRSDSPDPAILVHGVVSEDDAQALFAVVALASGTTTSPGRVTLPGLPPDRRFTVRPVDHAGPPPSTALVAVPWLSTGACLSGLELAEVGVQIPPLHPEQTLLLHLVREERA